MRMFSAVLLGFLITVPFALANEKNAQFKTLEPKHFTQAEGVELTPAFNDYFYAELRAELQKAKLANEVVGEGEAVDDADAPNSAVIVGTITEYKKGNVAKSVLIGFTAGWQSLKMDADVQRRSDKQTLYTLHVHTRMDPRWNEKIMAKACAKEIIKEMKSAQKAQPK
jgi:Domain of unknown function (DUF4410)